MDLLLVRKQLIATALKMNSCGINHGASGNLSVRVEDGFLITPTGMEYDQMTPEDIVLMHLDGSYEGPRIPSSEWRFHRDLFATRSDVSAVLHAHPVHCTAIACLRRNIPAFHYMVAIAGGSSIRCAPYALFGTEELSRHVLVAMEQRQACLLANHGLLVAAADLQQSLKIAIELESLAAMYLQALSVGEPTLLNKEEMQMVLEKFQTYGQQKLLCFDVQVPHSIDLPWSQSIGQFFCRKWLPFAGTAVFAFKTNRFFEGGRATRASLDDKDTLALIAQKISSSIEADTRVSIEPADTPWLLAKYKGRCSLEPYLRASEPYG